MKKILKIAITLTAIVVAVKVVDMNKKTENKLKNKVYFGSVEPTTTVKGDIWFKPNGEMKKY